MDNQQSTTIAGEGQEVQQHPGRFNVTESAAVSKGHYRGPRPHCRFSASDKRSILKSSIKLFARRLEENLPVTADNLKRLVPYGDRAA